MGAYILRRLALMIPTIIGIMGISFLVIQFAPGGPVEQVVAQLTGQGDSASDRLSAAAISWVNPAASMKAARNIAVRRGLIRS